MILKAAQYEFGHFRPFRPQLAAGRPVVPLDIDQDDLDGVRFATEDAAGFTGDGFDQFSFLLLAAAGEEFDVHGGHG